QEGVWMFTVSTIYFSLIPLIFLYPAIRLSLINKDKKLPVVFFSVLSLIILLFSFGGNFFLHKLFYDFVPLFNKFRNAGHIIYLLEMLMALISAYFTYKIFEEDKNIRKVLTLKYLYICAGIVVLLFILSASGTINSFWKAASNPQVSSWISSQFVWFAVLAFAYLGALFLYIRGNIKKNI